MLGGAHTTSQQHITRGGGGEDSKGPSVIHCDLLPRAKPFCELLNNQWWPEGWRHGNNSDNNLDMLHTRLGALGALVI